MKTFGHGAKHPEVQVEQGMLGSSFRYMPLRYTWAVCVCVCGELLYRPSLAQCVEEVTLSVTILWLRQNPCLWWKPTENSEHWCLKADVTKFSQTYPSYNPG